MVDRWHGRPLAAHRHPHPGDRRGAAAAAGRRARRATRESWCAPTATGCACRHPRTSLTIAAFGDAAVRVAARLADRMVINLCTPCARGPAARAAPPPRSRGRRRGAAAGRLGPGRRRSDRGGDRSAQQRSGGLPGGAGLRRDVRRRGIRRAGRARTWRDAAARAPGHVPPELCRAIGLVGSETEAKERAGEYRAAGVDELAIVPATAGDPGGRRTLKAIGARQSLS